MTMSRNRVCCDTGTYCDVFALAAAAFELVEGQRKDSKHENFYVRIFRN